MSVPFLNRLLTGSRLSNDFHVILASNQGDEPFEDYRVIVGYEDAYRLHRYETQAFAKLNTIQRHARGLP